MRFRNKLAVVTGAFSITAQILAVDGGQIMRV
jgi:hypothetical protein